MKYLFRMAVRQTSFRLGWLVLSVLPASAWVAHAATYTFYFNNTEQGAHATSKPSVGVTNEGADKVGAGAINEAGGKDAPAEVAHSSAESGPVTKSEVSVARAPTREESIPSTDLFRVSVGIVDVWDGDAIRGIKGPAINIGYFFNPLLGINAFMGGTGGTPLEAIKFFAGAEVEFTPLRLNIARMTDLFTLGLLAGVNTISPAWDNWFAPHLGARLAFNWTPHWGIVGAVRANASFVMADAGLSIRF